MTAATRNPSATAARHTVGAGRIHRAARALRRSPMTLWGLMLLLAIVIVCFIVPAVAHMDAYTTDTARMLEKLQACMVKNGY